MEDGQAKRQLDASPSFTARGRSITTRSPKDIIDKENGADDGLRQTLTSRDVSRSGSVTWRSRMGSIDTDFFVKRESPSDFHSQGMHLCGGRDAFAIFDKLNKSSCFAVKLCG